ncbi:MAG: ACP S-malonyltransferase [Candidatus Omnitrophota bacterium]|nr:ACP S-malonyltransferase [Candidatus Omnitrophota bacterium]
MNNVCYIFPGQGSQYAGMGKDLYDNSPEARDIFDQAEKILPGLDLKKLCFEGTIEELTKTSNSQSAILVTSIAALMALGEVGTEQCSVPTGPVCCAGLSLGEYSALVAAGAILFEDAVRLVRRRGQLMEEAGLKNPGTMASIIGLDIGIIKEVCRETGAEIANLNSPGQIVISGKIESVKNAMALSQEKGAKKAIPLNVSGPFHSSLMKETALEFRKELDKINFSSPKVNFVSNVTADYVKDIKDIKENLVKQLYSTVRWEESIVKMASSGCDTFFEIGPGKVLKGLLRRINPELKVYNIEVAEDVKKAGTT